MSRSFKKNPYRWVCGCKRKVMKKWKTQINRSFRKNDVDVGNVPSLYKKFLDLWSSPSDGKTYDPNWKKSWRK